MGVGLLLTQSWEPDFTGVDLKAGAMGGDQTLRQAWSLEPACNLRFEGSRILAWRLSLGDWPARVGLKFGSGARGQLGIGMGWGLLLLGIHWELSRAAGGGPLLW